MREPNAFPRRGDVVTGMGVTILGPLGRGGFGHVHAATDATGRALAVKLVPLAPGADRELVVARSIGLVPGVMPLQAAGFWRSHLVTVMPRATASLADVIDRGRGSIDARIRAVLTDVLPTLLRLTTRTPAIAHRDIHPGNIVLLGGRWIVSDLGIAVIGDPDPDDPLIERMTVPYAAPERWLGPAGGAPGDVYSIGILIHALATGSAPSMASGSMRVRRPAVDAAWFRGRSSWARLARRCVATDPAERPTMAAIARDVLAR